MVVRWILHLQPIRASVQFGSKSFSIAALLEAPIKSDYPAVEIPSIPFHETVLGALREHMKSDQKIAFVCAENQAEITYKTVYDTSHAVSSFLQKNNFQRDVACAVLPNHWAWAPFFLGVAMNGGALTGISPMATEYELKRQLVDSEAKVVLTNTKALNNVLNAAQDCTSVQHVICIRDEKDATFPYGVFCWDRDVVNAPIQSNAPNVNIDIHRDIITLPYSSGTTGTPKGVMITHHNYSAMISIFSQHQRQFMSGALESGWDRHKDKHLLVLPFYHCYGFGFLMNGLISGSPIVMLSHFQPDVFCETVQLHRIRFAPVVPSVLNFLAKSPLCEEYDLNSLELIMSYGMSEATMATHLPDVINGQPFGSVGKLLPNLEMKVSSSLLESDEVPCWETGEVCIRGPTVMHGYFRNTRATEDTITDGWLHTGDIGYLDNNHYLFIVDRLKELIKVKGFQVAPAELEGILLSHPEIHDAAVIGIPDDRFGEIPKAYVLNILFLEKVSPYKYLTGGVEFVDTIPRSQAGKILRRVLRDGHFAEQ
ncbi:unnamed protein product [Nippostrongylus brasiliensis]|uniref:4-coumarate--CoA ligase n=1 Tax=Nippostrongylus brasiliensis TaxID=27835 RepID=A0A0N4Y6B0_NIPBR|nr:unnamed protein product [Nippostrongylus brasiliensis]